jgi:hypothetical protein
VVVAVQGQTNRAEGVAAAAAAAAVVVVAAPAGIRGSN